MNTQIIIPLAIVVFLLLIIILTLFIRYTVITTIEAFSWERKVFLEHYVWVQESSYTDYPTGSQNRQSAIERYQSYEMIRQEAKTTVTNGTTTTTMQPVYGFVSRRRTKYTYEIQKWIKSRELLAKGKERATLHWPAYTLDLNTQERVKSRQEKYLVFFQTAKGKKYEQEIPETEWSTLDDKCVYKLNVTIFGQITSFVPTSNREDMVIE